MYSSNVRVYILEEELERIKDYVRSVPHRATGGLLLGYWFHERDEDCIVITRGTLRVPEEYLADEKTCANHPLFTVVDVGKAQERAGGAIFLGRWHAHVGGLNRPSDADYRWAQEFLNGRPIDIPFILHPILVTAGDEVTFNPYITDRGSGSFQKVPWQAATAEEIERLRPDQPPPPTYIPEGDSGLFSLDKVRGLFREESARVATLPHVVHSEVVDDGTRAILAVDMAMNLHRIEVQIAGDPWYPLHAPTLTVRVDDKASKMASKVLNEWTSMCGLQDIVHEVGLAIEALFSGETLPPPPTDEVDPVKREIAMLASAGYRVYVTPTRHSGSLLTVRSALLDGAHKVYYAILPPEYPDGTPAWALADEGVPLAKVAFQNVEDKSSDFTLLTWLEQVVPAAREQRAQTSAQRKRGPRSVLVIACYVLLFGVSGLCGYLFQTTDNKDINTLWTAVVTRVRERVGLTLKLASAPKKKLSVVPLSEKKPVLAVVMDAGMGTNMNTPETKWAAGSALHPVAVSVLQIDLRNPAHDVERTLQAGAESQALIVFSYAAGDRQVDFIKSLQSATDKPVGVISMAPGESEDALADNASFYQAAHGTGASAAQRALLELKRNGTLVVK